MSRPKPLTQRAHELVAAHLESGGIAIDATAGNGYDTCFLAERVGLEGHVYGFDIQDSALQNTRQRLDTAGLASQVTLICDSHEHITRHIPEKFRGAVSAIVFNLGYLPGSNKETITRSESTTRAIESSFELLAPGGIITILAYRGHEGGQEEAASVKILLDTLVEQGCLLGVEESPGPVLYTLLKKG